MPLLTIRFFFLSFLYDLMHVRNCPINASDVWPLPHNCFSCVKTQVCRTISTSLCHWKSHELQSSICSSSSPHIKWKQILIKWIEKNKLFLPLVTRRTQPVNRLQIGQVVSKLVNKSCFKETLDHQQYQGCWHYFPNTSMNNIVVLLQVTALFPHMD